MTTTSPLTAVAARQRDKFLLVVVDAGGSVDELAAVLGGHPIDVVVHADPVEALLRVGSLHPNAVLAAARLQPIESVALVRAMRQTSTIPVLIGVSDADGEQAAAALSAGAAACVARPYRPAEILPILRAILPSTVTETRPVQAGALRLDPTELRAHLHGRPIRLPQRECQLLHLLMLNTDKVVTREQIRTRLWATKDAAVSNTITVHIQRLRTRLGDDPHNPTIIQTVRGLGYRLVAPAEPAA
jgi:DNA-binding response OmpR family regulator